MATTTRVRRLDLGYFIRPAVERGTPDPRVEAQLAYLVRSADGVLLFDTGLGVGDRGSLEDHYRPHRRPLTDALAAAGLQLSDVDLVVNCHLHVDHCGGNPLFPGVEIVTQATELALARGGEHTLPELVEFPGVTYRVLDGEAELLPGVTVVPTPGHTAGHQSLVVRDDRGATVLMGQGFHFASDFSAAELTRRAATDGAPPPLPDVPPWLDRVRSFEPRRVLFAHDACVWEPATQEVAGHGG